MVYWWCIVLQAGGVLCCCTNTIHHLFEWEISSDPGPSDHYKIAIALNPGSIRHTKNFTAGWNLKRADWTKFEELVDLALEDSQNPDISVILRAISSAANQQTSVQTSVPKSKLPRKKASAPWWTPAWKKAEAQRTRALKQFNPRPAGPLDFPPPAGGGRLNAPPP